MKKKIAKIISNIFSNNSIRKPKNNTVVEKVNAEGNERCVMCGCLTDIQISTPIDLRENYVIGFGQLCYNCATLQQESPNTLTNTIK